MNIISKFLTLIKLLIFVVGLILAAINGLIHSSLITVLLFLIVIFVIMCKYVQNGKTFMYGILTVVFSFLSNIAFSLNTGTSDNFDGLSNVINTTILGEFFAILMAICLILMVREIKQ